MSDEIIEMAEQLAKWEEKDFYRSYESIDLQNPYALVGCSWKELVQKYMAIPIGELKLLYCIGTYKEAIRNLNKHRKKG